MFTIIGADGKEYGPVATDKVRDWLAGGRANMQTRARRDGETDWKTLGDFPEFATATDAAPPPVAGTTLAAPGASVPTRPAGPVDAKAYADDLIARAAAIDIFETLGASFRLWTTHFWPLVGVTLLIMIVQMVAGMVPIIGIFAGFVLNGVFYGGLYYYYLGKLRGEPREIGDAFAGFSQAFVPLMLTTLLNSVITMAILIPFFFPLLAVFLKTALSGGHPPTDFPALGGLAIGAIFVGAILLVYISVSWVFAFALVIDKGLGPWTAMEVSRRVVGRQWFRVFFAMLFGGILSMLGMIGLIIGVVFTLPLAFGTIVCAYEEICNPPPKA
jgi:uncharacterized membrane protein